ncbi:hypothetical protein NIES932_23120 [Raphidiopsis curvata NIES-932]|nr:hypothetical protein NIES932_23120 [Raphidiopsis curvata NIES-932]
MGASLLWILAIQSRFIRKRARLLSTRGKCDRSIDCPYIPLDYKGFMGVPITFLHKFNPDQFEIIKFRKGNDEKDLSIHGKCPYFRIIIKNKRILTELSDNRGIPQV